MKKLFGVFFLLFNSVLLPEQLFQDIVPGDIFVVDEQGYMYTNENAHTIRKYSPEGNLMLKIGQKGEGPGDIRRLSSFAINPNDHIIYVTEYFGGNRWISKFSTEGEFLGEWKCSLDRTKWRALGRIQFDNKGHVFIEAERNERKPYKDFYIFCIEKVFLKFTPDGRQIGEEIFRVKIDNSIMNKVTMITIPFQNGARMEISNDWLILKEYKDEYVGFHMITNEVKKNILIPFKPDRVTKQNIENWKRELEQDIYVRQGTAAGWLDLNFFFKRMPYPEYQPVTDIMFTDSRGFLYIKKYSSFEKGEKFWARIDPSNGKTCLIKSKPCEELIALWKNKAFYKRFDENDDFILAKTEIKDFFNENI